MKAQEIHPQFMFGLIQSVHNHTGSAGLWVFPQSKQATKKQSIRMVPEPFSDTPQCHYMKNRGPFSDNHLDTLET